MRDVFVVGIGMTRFAKQPDASVKSLTAQAVTAALADAGRVAGDVQSAFFANTVQGALEGQLMVRGQIALRPIGFAGIPIINVENACASGSSAFALAVAQVRAGACDVALAVGADKMVVPDKAKMFAVFDGAWDVHDVATSHRRLAEMMEGSPPPPADAPEMLGRSIFMDIYAAFARAHMAAFGTTVRQIAAVSAKNHEHAVHNPRAQYREAMSVDQVLGGPGVIWPLTVPMCSPVSDGASAAIVCAGTALWPEERERAVKVLSTTILTGVPRDLKDVSQHLTAIGAARAYDEAGIGPGDISLAEVHDATAFAEIQQIENLGLCGWGEGGSLTERGETRIGGRIPVNPSGGLECKGHPIGATGLGQIFELVTQLRGEAGPRQVEAARFAIAENGGGFYGIEEAVACLTILAAPHA